MTQIKYLIVFLFFSISCYGQEIHLLKGTVVDSITNHTLPGTSLSIPTLNLGSSTDGNGHFKLKVPKGNFHMTASFIGYESKNIEININSDLTLIIQLNSDNYTLKDVQVSSERKDDNLTKNNIGQIEIESKEFKLLPSLMGKPDIINALRMTPGVQSVGEGNPGLYIRGGDAGQNLFLLDNMPLYNPSHLMGFFPVFNGDIINKATVIKGGIPAQYGGKASSIIDLTLKGENPERFETRGSIGLLSSDLTIESPFAKNKGAVLFSVRRTYLELIQNLSKTFYESGSNLINQSQYNFTDASLKIKYKLSPKTRIFLNTFGSIDHYLMTDDNYGISNDMDWSNLAGSFRINHQFNQKHFFDLTAGRTLYSFNIEAKLQLYGFYLHSGIDDWFSKADFTYLRKNKYALKYGFNYTKHFLTPNDVNIDADQLDYNNANQYISNEFSTYINSEFELSERFHWSAGLRPSYFQHLGPYTHYIRNELDQISDSTVYNKNEKVADFYTIDGNLNCVYTLKNSSSLKGSLSIVHQFIHLASVGTVSLPTDVWLASTSFIPPQRVSQINLGYFKNFRDHMFESSIELYYKDMHNQIDFKNGVLDNFDNTKFERNVLIGKGMAVGAEFIIKKKVGSFTGWGSYTLSRTFRQFDEINDGKMFPAKYDRIHDLSVVLNYQLNHKWSLSAAFIYATGNAMTLPAGRYLVQGNIANHYTEVNSFRMPSYHRLDISANYQLKKRGRLESFLNFSIYNVYNRSNPYYIYFQAKGDLEEFSLSVKPEQISLFPILPSVTWTFKF